MKKAVVIFGIAAVLIAAVCAAGCVASDPLVGEWTTDTSDKAGIDCTYNADGTGMWNIHLSTISASVDITWTKVSDGKYTISPDSELISALRSVFPGDGTMTVTFSDDKKTAVMSGVKFIRKA